MTTEDRLREINNAFSIVARHRDAIERDLRGKKVAYYGATFRITDVRAEIIGEHFAVYASGPVLKKDGQPHARSRGSMSVDRLQFID